MNKDEQIHTLEQQVAALQKTNLELRVALTAANQHAIRMLDAGKKRR